MSGRVHGAGAVDVFGGHRKGKHGLGEVRLRTIHMAIQRTEPCQKKFI